MDRTQHVGFVKEKTESTKNHYDQIVQAENRGQLWSQSEYLYAEFLSARLWIKGTN